MRSERSFKSGLGDDSRDYSRKVASASASSYASKRPGTSVSKTSRPQTSTAKRPATGTEKMQMINANSSVYLCISEARKREHENEIAIASMNVVSGECNILFFKDLLSYSITLKSVLLMHPGNVLIFQPSQTDPTKLFVAIGDRLAAMTNLTITTDRKAYNPDLGRELVQSLSIADEGDGSILSLLEGPGNYFVNSAIAALFDFISTSTGISFKQKSVCFRQVAVDGTMMIDYQTAKCLELVQNNSNTKSNESLFGILNQCSTKMGVRLLRSSILQPLAKLVDIQLRQLAVKELLEQRDVATNAHKALCDFPDLDNLIASLIQIPKKKPAKFCEQSINRILQFKLVIEKSMALKDLLVAANLRSKILVSLCQSLVKIPLSEVKEEIHAVIDRDVTFQKNALGLRNQKTYAVRAGVDGLLDVARQTYKEANEDANELFTAYSESFNIPLKIGFTTGIGYFLKLGLEDLGTGVLPDVFLNVVKKGKNLHFTSLELTCLNTRIQEAMQEVFILSEKNITELLIYIHSNIHSLYKISEVIATLDLVLSLSAYASSSLGRFSIPEFTSCLALKSARHPILAKSIPTTIVPNDVYADNAIRLQFLTGSNMSGKSTYLNQIALMQVMAQIGCHIPCEFGSVRLCEQLLTRIGYDDCVVAQVSSFSLEMKECAFLLDHATDTSLIIIDELGRGTCTADAVAISIAIAESLLMDTKAFVYFSTHFHQVCQAFQDNPNAAVLQMKTTSCENCLYDFKVEGGVSQDQHYGLALARKIGFPNEILDDALAISRHLEFSWLQSRENNAEYRERKMFEFVVKEAFSLSIVRQTSTLTAIHLRKHLMEMQKILIEKDVDAVDWILNREE